MALIDKKHRLRGCLIGGAIGDALGYPVEFMSAREIFDEYGKNGIVELPKPALVSDDTQMTLFTAEAMLSGGSIDDLHRSYMRWYFTQTGWKYGGANYSGGLLEEKPLFARRAPGGTCLSALGSGQTGSTKNVLNNSKGCGGVMRAAPCAVSPEAYQLGVNCAAITHGHPDGYISAGAFAAILREILPGNSLEYAVNAAITMLEQSESGCNTLALLKKAVKMAAEPEDNYEAVESLGGGWTGDEALAIAVYCALCHAGDFAAAVRMAVNHSGDSDSTGAICGNIMGMLLGEYAIPARMREAVELGGVVLNMADMLAEKYGI